MNETPAAAETPAPVKKPRGLAAVSPERRREISRMGGKAAEAAGVRHRFNPETARAAGQKAAAKLHAEGKAYQWTSETAKAASLRAMDLGRASRVPAATPLRAEDEGPTQNPPAMD